MRRRRNRISGGGELLLRELVESVPVGSTPILRPVALRSVELQRRQALAGYALRSRVDTVLFHAEWLLGLMLVVIAGTFAARGPIDNWLHPAPEPMLCPEAHRPVVQSPPAPTPIPSRRGMAEPAMASWEIQRPRDGARGRHPELGRALPSSREPVTAKVELANVEPARRSERTRLVPDAGILPEPRPTRTPLKPDGSLLPEPRPALAALVPDAGLLPEPEPALAALEPAPAPPLDLSPIYLEAPAARLKANVVEVFLREGAWQVADFAAGYHHGTGLPGEGNLVMAGHKGIRGAVFANLEALRTGDEVFVDTVDQRFRYRVRETRRVWPSEVEVMYPTSTPTLTLLTCTNWDLQRFVVTADLVDSAPRVAGTGS